METITHNFVGFEVIEICPTQWPQNLTKQCLFFSPAAGISSGTYLNFLKAWAQNSGQRIFAMDCRGVGGSAALETFAAVNNNSYKNKDIKSVLFGDNLSPLLQEDLFCIFNLTKDLVLRQIHTYESKNQNVQWTLAGHSLGGWTSLLVAHRCFVKDLVLFDISILPRHMSVLWTLACVVRQRRIHTLAKLAKTRKVCYRSEAEAKRVFRRSPLFRGWASVDLDLYLQSNFTTADKGFELKHDPQWEAALLESQQPSATSGFLGIPKSLRNQLNIKFVVGEKSEACTLEGASVTRSFFANSKWIVLPDARHMFPFTHLASLMRLLCNKNPSVEGVVAELSTSQTTTEATPEIRKNTLVLTSEDTSKINSRVA